MAGATAVRPEDGKKIVDEEVVIVTTVTAIVTTVVGLDIN
jgi:hypothetical protein